MEGENKKIDQEFLDRGFERLNETTRVLDSMMKFNETEYSNGIVTGVMMVMRAFDIVQEYGEFLIRKAKEAETK